MAISLSKFSHFLFQCISYVSYVATYACIINLSKVLLNKFCQTCAQSKSFIIWHEENQFSNILHIYVCNIVNLYLINETMLHIIQVCENTKGVIT